MADPSYVSRGNEKVKTRTRCPGSQQAPLEVVTKGKTYKSGNKVKGERPTGKCPECFEVFGLAIQGDSWVLRRHSPPGSPSERYIKVSEETWGLLNDIAKYRKISDIHEWSDKTLNLILVRMKDQAN